MIDIEKRDLPTRAEMRGSCPDMAETVGQAIGRIKIERDNLRRYIDLLRGRLSGAQREANEYHARYDHAVRFYSDKLLNQTGLTIERDDLRRQLESARDLACELGNKAGRWHLQREALKGGVKRVVSKLWDMENERNGAMTAYVLQKEETNEAQALYTKACKDIALMDEQRQSEIRKRVGAASLVRQQAEEIARLRGWLNDLMSSWHNCQGRRLPLPDNPVTEWPDPECDCRGCAAYRDIAALGEVGE